MPGAVLQWASKPVHVLSLECCGRYLSVEQPAACGHSFVILLDHTMVSLTGLFRAECACPALRCAPRIDAHGVSGRQSSSSPATLDCLHNKPLSTGLCSLHPLRDVVVLAASDKRAVQVPWLSRHGWVPTAPSARNDLRGDAATGHLCWRRMLDQRPLCSCRAPRFTRGLRRGPASGAA